MKRAPFFVLTVAALAPAAVACSNDDSGSSPTEAASADLSGTAPAAVAPAEPAPAPAEPNLVEGTPAAPEGITLEAQNVAGASIQLPAGWPMEPMGAGAQAHDEASDITIMVQKQPNVPAEARSEFVDSFVEVNGRDAPEYRVVNRSMGLVSGKPSARVDGTFNNGTAYVTRDYVVFADGNATAIMVRGPEPAAAKVQGLADAVAASFGH